MARVHKEELAARLGMATREYGINTVLFRHAVGDVLGVNVTDMECLALIFFRGLATPSELARYTGLTSGATTAMLDRLEKARLIERRPNPQDRRGTLIVLTDERTDELSGMFAPLRQATARLTSGYSEKELEVIAGYLEKLGALWGEERVKLQHRQPVKP